MELVKAELEADGEVINREHIQPNAITINKSIVQCVAASFTLVSVGGV